ncbi:MAG: hypothetical protein V2A73_04895, partial [Pseudomonadota bacterium]
MASKHVSLIPLSLRSGDYDSEPLRILRAHYQDVVERKFDGLVPSHFRIVFNPLLRRLTGRITYSQELIEISRFHYEHYGL